MQRGTPRQTNTALYAPVLCMGAERSLVIISCFFWGWLLLGIFPHWPMLIAIFGLAASLYLLRFVAKRDPRGVAVFRANSRFLVQKRFYLSSGFAGNITKTRKVRTIPVNLTSRL